MEARLPNGNIVHGKIAEILVRKGKAVNLAMEVPGNIVNGETVEKQVEKQVETPVQIKPEQKAKTKPKTAGRPKKTVKK
jgi:hypothetical protein